MGRLATTLLALTACHTHTTTSSTSSSSEHDTSQVLSTSNTSSHSEAVTTVVREEAPERIEETVTVEEPEIGNSGLSPVLRRTVTHRVIERGPVETRTSEQATATAAGRTSVASTSTRVAEAVSEVKTTRDSAPVGLPSAWWLWGAAALLVLGGVGWWWLRRRF